MPTDDDHAERSRQLDALLEELRLTDDIDEIAKLAKKYGPLSAEELRSLSARTRKHYADVLAQAKSRKVLSIK